MNSKISFIIPAFNAEKTIQNCINSIMCISDVELEIIVVDDGSTDGTLGVISEYAKKNKNITVISQKNSGPNIARKNGVEKSQGEYIFFCDADDTVDSKKMHEVIDEVFKSQYDIYEFGYKTCYENGMEEINDFNKRIIEGDEVLLHFLRQKYVTNFLWNKCFKREKVENIEFVRLFAAEDSCDLLQIFSKSISYCSLPIVAYNYVQTENSLCRSKLNIRRLDEIKGDEFKLNYLSSIEKDEHKEYLYVQAMAHCAYLYGELSTSSVSDKEQYMHELKDKFKGYERKIKFNSDAFRVASLKRKFSIIVFCISPWIYKCFSK